MSAPHAPAELTLHGSRILIGAALQDSGADTIRAAATARRIAVITDSNVAPLHARPLADRLGVTPDDLFDVPAGESSKSRGEWSRLSDAMLARGFGRDTLVVAVGGGVVGDLGGFVAATYMRGVPVVQVPTSLLAMIDASIGGKTGVDTHAGKNLVGAFHHPVLVLADPLTLKTLDIAELRNGLAEALKHALITSATEYDWFIANAPGLLRDTGPDVAVVRALVERNVKIKAGIVARDGQESGVRKTLNVGHTIGHALETASRYAMLHGECVGIGMRVEAMISVALGLADETLVAQIIDGLRAVGLPTRPSAAVRADQVVSATRLDKKSRGGSVEYALLRAPGVLAEADGGFGTRVADAVVLSALTRAFAG